MRLGRGIILAAILAILVFLGNVYIKRKATLASDSPAPPSPLEAGVESRAGDWCWNKSDEGRPKVRICAAAAKQIKEPSLMELQGVELWLYRKEATQYDLIKSDRAEFDIAAKSLFSDGAVEITMGITADGPQHGRLLKISTSGVRFSSDSGKAVTDRATHFEFDTGGGSSMGAEYDPDSRELHLLSQVALDWRGKAPDSKPMHVESGEAMYRERESKVILFPWSKLTRDTLHLEGGMSVVMLKDGEITNADVATARGVQDDPGRKVEFAADRLGLDFAESMTIHNIGGNGNARLVSTSSSAKTTVTSERLELAFLPVDKQSVLDNAVATGKSTAESVPVAKAGTPIPESRVLRSETIRLKMRPGGREIERAETDGPGTLDFIPTLPGQPRRNLKGDRIWIAYGPDNQIQSFRSVNVTTRTDKPPTAKQPNPPPAVTQSKEILASFKPSGELDKVEQKSDFRYQEGERQARADTATLDQQSDLMTLLGGARAWDPTGSVTADRILLNEKTGDYTAEGHVTSMRQPDRDGKSSAMLSTDEVLQAQAQRMISSDSNRKVHYEGKAVAWQGANRVEADRLDIDRGGHVMEAHGNVRSEFVDKSDKSKDGKPAASPVFTVVRAPELAYSDETRVALYQGGVSLARPGLTVNSRELRAYLKDSDSNSSLDKTIADGSVKIVSTLTKAGTKPRTRTGTSEHAEYYTDDSKVILERGQPVLIDSLNGKTTGKQLIWFANNDKLQVNGDEHSPVESTIRKK